MEPINRTIERWPLDKLRPHPKQHVHFRELAKQPFADLVESLRANGLQNPVEALPDGTIICGHQRLRAAQHLGWTEIDVWIREDLAAQGEAAIEERLISDNLNRRQLDKLDLARCYAGLRDLEHARPGKERRLFAKGTDFRDVMAEKLGANGLSGRSLDRYLRILHTPLAVQDAFSEDKLTLGEAGKVAGLSEAVQAAIAAEITAGRDAKTVVQRHLREQERPSHQNKKTISAANSVLRQLRQIKETNQPTDSNLAARLLRARAMIDELLAMEASEGSGEGKLGENLRKAA